MVKIKSLNEIDGLKRVWISNVYPEIDSGDFPAKRIINEEVKVEADIYSDGIDAITAILLVKHESEDKWQSYPFTLLNNDRMQATFTVNKLGNYYYTIQAWIDEFTTWKTRFLKKLGVNSDVDVEKQIGINILEQAGKNSLPTFVKALIEKIKKTSKQDSLTKLLADKKLNIWINKTLSPSYITHYSKTLIINVDRLRAQFSAWYEVFPRSLGLTSTQHGTFNDLLNYLPKIKAMGFDVIYLTPIHPIGKTNRKGKNNSVTANRQDLGSPWAIGAVEGGHQAIHPQLGTLTDFKKVIRKALQLDMEIAMDFALQCSPDHPYLKQHPTWFKQRPDGTLQYAENPPKKYQDIYPINFSTSDWPAMWAEFKAILMHWIKAGVKIFRVDNPHTKSFIFWQWVINDIKKQHPDVLFLAEAFTRPKIMYHLAKSGFSQSYTYFTWRNTKAEITEYMLELTSPPVCDFFRPNFWPNTPDILPDYLQKGGKPAFIIRFILAATLGSNYGIYGPAFENCLNTPLHEGSEEYLDSEKYECRQPTAHKNNITALITQVNKIRQTQQSLHNLTSLTFHPTDNPLIICYSKHTKDFKNTILVVVNLDYTHKQSGFVDITLKKLGLTKKEFTVHDLLTDESYSWHEGRCYVELSPSISKCAHIFLVKGE